MDARRAVLLLVSVIALSVGADEANAERRPMQDLGDPLLEQWLRATLAVSERDFLPIASAGTALFDALEESKGSCSTFLKEAADPHRLTPPPVWSAHAAKPGGLDLLRTQYNVGPFRLQLREGANFVIVEVAPSGPVPAYMRRGRAFLADVVQHVVKTDSVSHRWRFAFGVEFDQPSQVRAISNIGAPPLKDLMSRHDRVDIVTGTTQTYLVFYKKRDQLEGFLPGDRWFNATARRALEPKS